MQRRIDEERWVTRGAIACAYLERSDRANPSYCSRENHLVAVAVLDRPEGDDEHVERAEGRMVDRIDRLRQERPARRPEHEREGPAVATAVAQARNLPQL